MMMAFVQNSLAEELIVVRDPEPPTLEFLDYLGGMVAAGDELVGPEHFEEATYRDDAAATSNDSGPGDIWVTSEEARDE